MKKIKVGVIYGGLSFEHDISIKSAKSIINALDKEKYDIYDIYINKNNIWYDVKEDVACRIENIIEYLKKIDIVFPVLHGKYGEDGTIQGMLEMFNIPYIGCGVMSSSICMDKAYTKVLLDKYNIKQLHYIFIEKEKELYKYIDSNYDILFLSEVELLDKICDSFKLPIFIKPSSCGSSIGINKACSRSEIIDYINNAFLYDKRVVIEEYCLAYELECSVLFGNPSSVGEIVLDDSFYDFDEKYNDSSARILIPASISIDEEKYIKEMSFRIFNILDCKDLARIDFFMDKSTREIYVNEINTMPGFTDISMYKKLVEYDGISYSDLLDKLIQKNINN